MPVQLMNQQQRRMNPLLKKMNAEEEGLSVNQRLDLVISNAQVDKMMGPEPIPSLDIQMDEIQNELQRKMVEEIQCVVCGQFPYKPMECRKCNKLFCKYCQLQLNKAGGLDVDQEEFDNQQPTGFHNMAQRIDQKIMSAGRDGRGRADSHRDRSAGVTPGFDVCCPNCQERGNFLQEVNKVLKNCIDFCEFPHRCPSFDGRGEIIWKTLGELQAHAQFNCPKFGCDICYREEYQHMTRVQLYEHIKRDCPDVQIMCQVCNKEYTRKEFADHQCIRDFYVEKLKTFSFDVLENLADKLILHRRQKEGLGLCSKYQCVEKHRSSGAQYQESMITQNTENTACKCFRCKTVIAGNEDSYFCIYCNESYCPTCLGYCKYYDLEEMDQILLK